MIIGLTGGIAMGKSTITSYLIKKGYHVLDADKIAHQAYLKDSPCFQEIVSHFKTENRKEISKIVFHNKQEREYLESIIHPYVKQTMIDSFRSITFIDVPLLFEAKYDELCDYIITVYVPEEIQIKRLIERNHISKEEAKHRIDIQMPIEEKMKRSDYVIDNSKSEEESFKQIDQILKEILYVS